MSCPICCETWSKKVKECKCHYCDFVACVPCMEQYLVTSYSDPKCMNTDCKHGWTVDYLYSVMPKTFMTGPYKKHREVILYDREVAMLQATQPHVENILNKERLTEEIEALKLERNKISTAIMLKTEELDATRYFGMASRTVVSKSEYVGRCSQADCLGFISSASFSCGLCNTGYCKKCFVPVPKGEEEEHEEREEGQEEEERHKCKEEDIQTYKLIKSDTKPCPTCATLIFRISGCSQMFCTECKSVWDWNTGRVEQNENAMHNPHYYDWLVANGGRQAVAAAAPQAAGQCGANRITFNIVNEFIKDMSKVEKEFVYSVYRTVNHYKNMHQEVDPPTLFDKNLDLRIRYLRNDLTVDKLKSMVQIREKAVNKKREVRQILLAFSEATIDILVVMTTLPHKNKPIKLREFKIKFDNIMGYTKTALANVKKMYNCTVDDVFMQVYGHPETGIRVGAGASV